MNSPRVVRSLTFPPPERVWEHSGNFITNGKGDPIPLWVSRPWHPGEKDRYVEANRYETRSAESVSKEGVLS